MQTCVPGGGGGKRELEPFLLSIQATDCHCVHILAVWTREIVLRNHALLFFYTLGQLHSKRLPDKHSRGAGPDLRLDAPPRPLASRAPLHVASLLRVMRKPPSPTTTSRCPDGPRSPAGKKEKSPKALLFPRPKAVSHFRQGSTLLSQLRLC